jgi:hypothetical protein
VFEGFVADMYLSFKIDGNSNAQTFELNQSYIDQLTSITSIENLYLGYIENDSPYKLSLMEYAVLSNRYDLIDLLILNDYSEADVTYVDSMFFNRKAIHHARDLAMINKLEELGYSISDTYDYRECSNGCKVYENISILSNINMLGSDFDELLTYLGENEFDFMSQVNVYNNCTIAFECNETPSDFYTHLHSIIPEQLIPIEVVDTYVRKAVEYGFDVDLEDSKGNTIIDYLNERNEGEAGDQIIKTLIKEIKK